jgi:hypothetical protein
MTVFVLPILIVFFLLPLVVVLVVLAATQPMPRRAVPPSTRRVMPAERDLESE